MANTMSPQKQRIAKQVKALGLGEFNGIKENGRYRIGSVSFGSLKEIETYIKGVKEGKEVVSEQVVASSTTAIAKITEVRGRFADTVHYTVAVFSPEKGYTFLGGKDTETYDQALALIPGVRATTSDVEFAQWLTEIAESEPTAPKAETVISEQAKIAIETEVARQLSLWRSATIGSLRWIAYTRSLDIKSTKRQPIIDALVEDLRDKLMEKHGIAA
jgi:hypothetical protein